MYYFNQSERYRLEEVWSLFYTQAFVITTVFALVRNVWHEAEQTGHIAAVARCVSEFRTNTFL